MISGGSRVLDDDVGAFAVSTVRSCDSKAELRTPLYGSRVPLVLDIDPPRAFRRTGRINADVRIRKATLELSSELLDWCG